ncbi:MAG: M20/M25/M40 family metallo-hydrolase [bacterium]
MLNNISILQKIIKINTESSKSNLPLIVLAKEILEQNGFKIKVEKVKDRGVIKANLIATIGNQKNGGIILSCHTDTVSASKLWQTNPFNLTIKNNCYFGLGTIDVKGFLACAISASCNIIKKYGSPKRVLTLLLTFNEETDFLGVKELLAKNRLPKPILAVIGEPTNLKPAISHKGVSVVNIEIFGKEAHGSNPSQGINAIEAAGEMILAIKGLTKKPSCPAINIGKIVGGLEINKVPDFCAVDLEFRPGIFQENTKMFAVIKKIAQKIVQKKLATKIDIKETVLIPPFCSLVQKNILRQVEGMTKEKSVSVLYGSEAAFFGKQKIPTILLGPGDIRRAHQADEFITKEELYLTEKNLEVLIKSFCY